MLLSEQAQTGVHADSAKEMIFRALGVFLACPEGKKLPQAKPRKLYKNF